MSDGTGETGVVGAELKKACTSQERHGASAAAGELLDAVSREPGVEIYRLEAWRDQVLEGMKSAVKKRDGDPLIEELKTVKQHIGELTMEMEILRKAKEIILRCPRSGRKSRQ